jgi:hypothetical protein
VFNAKLCLQTVGISFEGSVKGVLDVMVQVVEGQRLKVPLFITLSAISIMMLGVLVLLGTKVKRVVVM